MWTCSGNWCTFSSYITQRIVAVHGNCSMSVFLSFAFTQILHACFRLGTPVGLADPFWLWNWKWFGGNNLKKVTGVVLLLSEDVFFPYCFLMPPMILLQQEELWELRAELRANRVWRVWRFKHRQLHWCVEWHAKTPNYILDMWRGVKRRAVSHADGDPKGMEITSWT